MHAGLHKKISIYYANKSKTRSLAEIVEIRPRLARLLLVDGDALRQSGEAALRLRGDADGLAAEVAGELQEPRRGGADGQLERPVTRHRVAVDTAHRQVPTSVNGREYSIILMRLNVYLFITQSLY